MVNALAEHETVIEKKIEFLTASLSEIKLLKAEVTQMQTMDFRRYAAILDSMGFNIFAALNKGFIAGVLSIVRTVGFNLMLLLTLPRIFDLTGVWMATPLSEAIAIIISLAVLLGFGKRYKYL